MRADTRRIESAWLAALLGLLLSTPLAARELPAALRAEAPALQLTGSAVMRRFGFKVYTARLWTDAQGFRTQAPYALDLEYALDISAAALVATSIAEMREQGHRDEAKLAHWSREMAAVFPDVRKGDRLIGYARPGVEVRFYSAQTYIASIRDAAFVEAFFGIWLDSRTSAPKVRARLLGAERAGL